MTIIITMAGLGSRFRKIGLDIPKYNLIARNKTLFEWSLLSLKNFFKNKFVFVSLKENNSREFIKQICSCLEIRNFTIVEIDNLTDGQASTVMKAAEFINPLDSIMVYNIDTYVDPEALEDIMIRGDGWMPAFEAAGDKWSFINFDKNFRVLESVEKRRISEFGTIGLYYFKSYKLFKELYYNVDFQGQSEKYIAPMYDLLLRNGSVYTNILPNKCVHALGTPEDVLLFDKDFIINNL
jgi:NDP-sugar pyrophosphorylase family protein